MSQDEIQVEIKNCVVHTKPGEEDLLMRYPLVIDGYAIIPLEEFGNEGKMKQVYVLHLVGSEDTWVGIVDKETWDWVNNYETKMPESVRKRIIDSFRKNNGYSEPLTDDQVMEDYSETDGSWDNDRAIHALTVADDGDVFETVGEAMNAARERGLEVVATYEGCNY